MDTHAFLKTRITLTSWYVGILAIILFAFSLVLYTGEQRDFFRVIVQRDFGGRIPHSISPSEQHELEEQLQALRASFILNLLLVDGVVLLFGGGLSYFLAGKTLSPIQETFDRQKLFLADVSHEIRTPLAAIQTATEVSLRNRNKTKDDYKKVLQQVYEETKRLTKMANDLLLLSRMESGASVTFSAVSLNKIVQDVQQEFLPVAKQKNIHIALEATDTVMVLGEVYSLTQLIMIFVDNALKYTKNGGSIKISLSNKPKRTLTIADTGVGISQKDAKRIFERFYQADTSRTQVGNGLGLAIAQQIAQLYKAKISVKSIEGDGTIFTIVFSE